jgi:hypothetical protein
MATLSRALWRMIMKRVGLLSGSRFPASIRQITDGTANSRPAHPLPTYRTRQWGTFTRRGYVMNQSYQSCLACMSGLGAIGFTWVVGVALAAILQVSI